MSSASDTGSDSGSSDPENQEINESDPRPQPATVDEFDWGWFTVRAEGPAQEERLREDSSAVARTRTSMAIERAVRSQKEFLDLVQHEYRSNDSDTKDTVVKKLLDDFPAYEQVVDAEDGWSIEVVAPVSVWEALGRWVAKTEFDRSAPLHKATGIGVLRNAMDYDVAGPNCALALAVLSKETSREKLWKRGLRAHAKAHHVAPADIWQDP
jgi:hypothetical protein